MLLQPPFSSNLESSAARYVMRGGGPPVKSDEVEEAARLAIEVVVSWGGDALCVSHFAAPSAVFVGDARDCDIALPAELLGAERRCVAVSTRDDVCAVLAAGARGWLTLPDGSTRPLDQRPPALEREPTDLADSTERLLPLALGYRVHLCFASLEIQVATVRLGRRSRRSLGVDASALASLGVSALMVAASMAVLSRLTPTLGLNQDEQGESARLRLLHTYLTAAAERAVEPRHEARPERARAMATLPPPPSPPPEGAAHDANMEAEPATAVEPMLGLEARAMPARDAIERRMQIQEARKFGIIGMLDWPELKDPTFRFEHHQTDEEVAMTRKLFTPDSAAPIDEGPGGLALSGTGIGGGGRAEVIALGAVRTVDEGQGGGPDRFANPMSDSVHTSQAPQVRQGESIVSDPLAAASIRRAVHAQRTALRGCYAEAAGHEAALELGAMVRFVVLGNGQIEQVSATAPSLPAHVSSCIERVFLGLSVPNPASRPVHVAYRVALDS